MTVRKSINTGLDAEAHRLLHGALIAPGSATNPLAARSGVFPSRTVGLRVHQTASPSANLLIERGAGIVQAGNPGQLGAYPFVNDAQVTLPYLGTYPASSQPRVDLVVARALDTTAGDASTGNDFTIVTGTPGSSADPAIPGSGFPLARINLPANATTVSDAMITRIAPATVAAGGLLPVPSQTEETAVAAVAYDGMPIVRLDTTIPTVKLFDASSGAFVVPEPDPHGVEASLLANGLVASNTYAITPQSLLWNPSGLFSIAVVAGGVPGVTGTATGIKIAEAGTFLIDVEVDTRIPGSPTVATGRELVEVRTATGRVLKRANPAIGEDEWGVPTRFRTTTANQTILVCCYGVGAIEGTVSIDRIGRAT